MMILHPADREQLEAEGVSAEYKERLQANFFGDLLPEPEAVAEASKHRLNAITARYKLVYELAILSCDLKYVTITVQLRRPKADSRQLARAAIRETQDAGCGRLVRRDLTR
jgi:hypothetical protein